MSGYVLSVIGTVLIASILTAILPEGKTVGVIKGIARLACVLAIVAPVLKFLQSNDGTIATKKTAGIFSENVIELDESFIQYYSEARVSQTERALEEELEEKYGFPVSVCIVWEQEKEEYADKYLVEEICVKQIKISCDENASEGKRKEMADYVAKNYCSEVLIE